jgi:hypothetical protein
VNERKAFHHSKRTSKEDFSAERCEDKQYQGKILNFIVKGLCCSLIHDVMLSKF